MTREKTIYVMTTARADKQLGPGLMPRPECATAPPDKPCQSGGSGRSDAIQLRAVTLTRRGRNALNDQGRARAR